MESELKQFTESFEKFVVNDLKKALDAGVEVGTVILTVVGIECLSGYFAGKKSDDQTFTEFVTEFMPAYSAHAKTIYKCIRNGLAHDYIIKEHEGKSFLFTRNHGEKHLVPVEGRPGWYYLNRFDFASAFLRAKEDFFNRVSRDPGLSAKAIRRLKQRSFLDVFPLQNTTEFAESDPYADRFDSATGTMSGKH